MSFSLYSRTSPKFVSPYDGLVKLAAGRDDLRPAIKSAERITRISAICVQIIEDWPVILFGYCMRPIVTFPPSEAMFLVVLQLEKDPSSSHMEREKATSGAPTAEAKLRDPCW